MFTVSSATLNRGIATCLRGLHLSVALNRKLAFVSEKTAQLMPNLRIGYGEDAHALEDAKELIIGNVKIQESPLGTIAHSDGDVLLHALTDALLSAYALGDIGHYFPPSNPDFKDMDSAIMLKEILAIIQTKVGEYRIHNVAAVVTLDKPKLGKWREDIQARVAELLGLELSQVGITFKTSEGLAQGHIQARVSVLLSTSKDA